MVSAAIRITVFWTVAFGFLYWEFYNSLKLAISGSVILGSCFFGILVTVAFIIMDKRDVQIRLVSKTIRGMFCTIGAIPTHAPTLAQSIDLPGKDVYPVGINDSNTLEQWKSRMDPAMQELYTSILRTLWEHKKTPASPPTLLVDGQWVDVDHHGGSSLITHCLLVANLMCEHSTIYKYAAPTHNDIALFKVLDPNYKLDTYDPLIPIIGLCHDIGKIECMVWEDGKATKMLDGHDYKGARILARMNAYWHPDIDVESRRILQAVVAHYHHVQDLPMERDGSPTSDRLHALMELLVMCDKAAAKIENCHDPKKIDAVKKGALIAKNPVGHLYIEQAIQPDDLISTIHRVLLGSGRINQRDKGSLSSIGWKYHLPQYNKSVVLLKEDVFIKAIANLIGIEISPDEQASGGVTHLTQEVLKTLNVANILFNDFDEDERSPVAQIYQANFYKPSDYFSDQAHTLVKENLSGVPVQFSQGSTIAIEVDDYPPLLKLKELENYTNVFALGKSRVGNRGARRKQVPTPYVAPRSTLDIVAEMKAVKPLLEGQSISSSRFKSEIERAASMPDDARGFNCTTAEFGNDKYFVLSKIDNWLLEKFNTNFEAISAYSEEWHRLAGIIEIKITEKGNKIIKIMQ